MDLSVISVTYNNEENIKTLLESVKLASSNLSVEMIVVDNNSSDRTVSLIKEIDPNIKFFEMGYNSGFAAANNQGLSMSSGKYVLFLNPDMKPNPDSFSVLIDYMNNNKDVGILGCKLVDQYGKFSEAAKPRRFPKLSDQLALLLKIPHIFPSVLNHYLFSDFNPEIEQEVDSVRGSFMLMRRSMIDKLGFGFDPRYYIWFEDVDICRECKKMGLKVVYTPIVTCVDFIGQSFKKQASLWKQKVFTKSMFTYFKKWEPWYQWLLIGAFRPWAILITMLFKK